MPSGMSSPRWPRCVPDTLRAGVGLLADALLAATLAPACAACRRVLEQPTAGPICSGCWSGIHAPPGPWCRTCGDALPSHDFPLMAQLYLDGKLNLDSMVTRRIGLDEVEEAFHEMETGNVIRSVIML